jgi:hypothetical protein
MKNIGDNSRHRNEVEKRGDVEEKHKSEDVATVAFDCHSQIPGAGLLM